MRAARIHGSLTAANDRCAITRCYHYSLLQLFDFPNEIKSYVILCHFAQKSNLGKNVLLMEQMSLQSIIHIFDCLISNVMEN